MIDWIVVLAGAAWLIGLSLIVASVSFHMTPQSGHIVVSRSWLDALNTRWAYGGALLICAGAALAADSVVLAVAWVGIGLVVAIAWLYNNNSLLAVPSRASETRVEREVLSEPAIGPRTSLVRRVAEWLVRAEPVLLLALSPLVLFPAPSRILVLIALPLLWIARRYARGHFVPRTPLDWPLLLLLLMVLVSIFATPDLGFSLSRINSVLLGVSFFYALIEFANTAQRFKWSIALYAVAGYGVAAIGLLGSSANWKFPILQPITSRLPSIIGLFTSGEAGFNPNEVGGAMLWFIPLQLSILAMLWRGALQKPSRRVFSRAGIAILVLITIAPAVLTQSRSAIVSLAVALAVWLWLQAPRLRALVLLLPLAAALILYLTPTQTVDPSTAEPSQYDSVVATSLDSVQSRVEVWSRALYAIQDFPITGTGMSMFRRFLPDLYPTLTFPAQYDLAHAHNQYLQVALDLGLPGLLAYLAIWMIVAALLVQTWRRTSDRDTRGFAVGIGASLLAFFIYGLTDAIAIGAKPSVAFWILLAFAVVLWMRSTQLRVESGPWQADRDEGHAQTALQAS